MNSPALGYLCLVLHCHLPYVRHPEHETFLEETWLYEAISDTYIPLLRVMDGLLRDGIDFRLTITLSPPLISMLRDPLLISRFERHINKLIELASKETDRTRFQPEQLRSLRAGAPSGRLRLQADSLCRSARQRILARLCDPEPARDLRSRRP